MKLAVTVANIFIDLIHTKLIEHLFCIDCEIHTCLEVFDELNETQQGILNEYRERNLLTIHQLSEQEHSEAHKIPSQRHCH